MNEEYVGVQLAWKRIIAIAQDLPDPAAIHISNREQENNENHATKNDQSYALSEALQHMFIITTQVEGYIAFMLTMMKELNYGCPTSLAFARHIIEHSEIPTTKTLKTISTLFIHSHDQLSDKFKINQYILWSMLAQIFAGNLSHALWTDAMYELLVTSITCSSSHPMLRLHALLVFENFALHGQLKKLFMNKRLPTFLRQVKREMKRKTILRSLKLYTSKKQDWIDIRQLQFALDWSLSHQFIKNAMNKPEINSKLHFINQQHQCKQSQDGFEVRNDTHQFETCYLSDILTQGIWYFEVLIFTNDIIQIGLCSKDDLSTKEQGFGVGVQNYGFAFDTYQSGIWIQNEIKIPKESRYHCKKGDVIGCLIDFEAARCVYYINGQEFSIHVQLKDLAKKGVLPIVCLTGYQHVRINVGQHSWLCKPPNHVKPFKWPEDRQVVKAATRQEEGHDDWDGPLCTLCFSEKKNTLLLPCKHTGFGKQCAEKLTTCPICRAEIKEKVSSIVLK